MWTKPIPEFLLTLPPDVYALLFISTVLVHAPYDPSPLLVGQKRFDDRAGALANSVEDYLVFKMPGFSCVPFDQTTNPPKVISGPNNYYPGVNISMGPTYVPVPPLTQYKGYVSDEPSNLPGLDLGDMLAGCFGKVSLFTLDSNNVPVAVWDDNDNSSDGPLGWRAFNNNFPAIIYPVEKVLSVEAPQFFVPLPANIYSLFFNSTPQVRAPFDSSPLLPGQSTFDAGYLAASVGPTGVPQAAPGSLVNYLAFNGVNLDNLPEPTVNPLYDISPNAQYKGIDQYGLGMSGDKITWGLLSFFLAKVSLFQTDANGKFAQIWDDSQGAWRNYLELSGDPAPMQPIIISPMVTSKSDLALSLAGTGIFKPKTDYILIGDEIKGSGTIDFKTLLSSDDYTQLYQYLTLMPRQYLRNFYMQNIYPGIPPDLYSSDTREGTMITDPIYGGTYQFKLYNDMIWQGFIDMFNTANIDYANKNNIAPWAWEQQKMQGYVESQNADAMATLQNQFSEYNDVTLALDPLAKPIMADFATLPKLGDIGQEINRQNAVKELLKMKEYESAQAIVDAYRYTNDTVLGVPLTKPILKPVVLSSGEVMAQASSPWPS